MSWLMEFKARKLADKHKLVSEQMALRALKEGCPHYIKIKNSQIDEAREFLLSNGITYSNGLVEFTDGRIFLRDEEMLVAVKIFYS